MNRGKYLLMALLVWVLQSTLLFRLTVFGARINLFLVFVVGASILYGSKVGGYTGLVLGLLQDIMFTELLGVRALLYFLIGTMVGEVMRNTSNNPATGGVAVAIGTLFVGVGEWIIFFLLRHVMPSIGYFKGPLFIEVVLNILVFWLVIWAMKRFLKPVTVNRYRGY